MFILYGQMPIEWRNPYFFCLESDKNIKICHFSRKNISIVIYRCLETKIPNVRYIVLSRITPVQSAWDASLSRTHQTSLTSPQRLYLFCWDCTSVHSFPHRRFSTGTDRYSYYSLKFSIICGVVSSALGISLCSIRCEFERNTYCDLACVHSFCVLAKCAVM